MMPADEKRESRSDQTSSQHPLASALNLSIHRVGGKVDLTGPRNRAIFYVYLLKNIRSLQSLEDSAEMAGFKAHLTFRAVREKNGKRELRNRLY